MKKFIIICLLLLVATPVFADGTVIKNSKSGYAGVSTQTRADMTLYVRTTGNDSNDCLSTGAACLTIQEAVDRVPKIVKHVVTVDVGPGNFAGFYITGFRLEYPSGKFEVSGTLGEHTPGTGTATGTATSGDKDTCTDSGQSWTGDELIGKMVLVAGEYRFIRDNDGTTIELVGTLTANCSGKAYQLIEHDTILDSFPASNTYAYIEGYGNVTSTVSSTESTGIWVTEFAADGQGGSYDTWWFWSGDGISIARIFGDEPYYGGGWQDCFGIIRAYDIWVEDGSSYAMIYITSSFTINAKRWMAKSGSAGGIVVSGVHNTTINEVYSEENGTHGLSLGANLAVNMDDINIDTVGTVGITVSASVYVSLTNVDVVDATTDGVMVEHTNKMDFSTLNISSSGGDGIEIGHGTSFVDIDAGTITGNSGYGVRVDENTVGNKSTGSSVNMTGTITVSNNTLGGIVGKNYSVIALTDVDGSGNGNYGLELEVGSGATITTATGITGTSGDATINAGTTALVWATDFNDDGDIVVNIDNGCRIERKD